MQSYSWPGWKYHFHYKKLEKSDGFLSGVILKQGFCDMAGGAGVGRIGTAVFKEFTRINIQLKVKKVDYILAE